MILRNNHEEVSCYQNKIKHCPHTFLCDGELEVLLLQSSGRYFFELMNLQESLKQNVKTPSVSLFSLKEINSVKEQVNFLKKAKKQ